MKKIFSIFISLFLLVLFSCSKGVENIVVWTDKAELASFCEMFNAEQNEIKVIIVYKEQIATALPPAKDEKEPDIVIGSLLKNSKMTKTFSPLDSLLTERDEKGNINEKKIDKDIFYKTLLDYGREFGKDKDGNIIEKNQYLLPVSFNLPIMIFSDKNKELVSDSYTIEIDEIKETSKKFNVKNKNNIYSKMGFAPSWNKQFIYTVAKMNGAEFQERENTFTWNEESLDETINLIKDWSKEINTSSTSEQDFSFKYLYTPNYKQISSGRCLFAYSTTSEFFSLAPEQIVDTDFRWFTNEESIFAEDDLTMIGIYKKAILKNNKSEKIFLKWVLNEDNQRRLLERNNKMKLGSETFGIFNGFSSIKSVNEKYFPTYYKNLLGNLPSEKYIKSPMSLPPRWKSLKERVLIPYISEATKTEDVKDVQTISERIRTWSKQFN